MKGEACDLNPHQQEASRASYGVEVEGDPRSYVWHSQDLFLTMKPDSAELARIAAAYGVHRCLSSCPEMRFTVRGKVDSLVFLASLEDARRR